MLSKRLTLSAIALPLLAALCCGPLRAAELGEVKVNSFLGQQLSADIELVDLTPADLAEIQAKLASPDVFKGAGLSVQPVLGGMHISVAKRDNRRFLHLTTLQPVNSEALHLFLELNSGGRQIIRAATLWMTPEPPAQRAARIASASAAAATATPAAAPMPALVPSATATAAKPVATDGSDAGLSAAAERAFAARKQMPSAPASTEPSKVATSAPAVVAAASKPAAKPARPAPEKSAAVPAAAKDTTASAAAPAPAPAQACAPAQVEAQIQQCQAMTGKLVDLEGKVQRLQQALTAPAPAPAVAAHAASVAPARAAPPAAAKVAASPSKPEPAPTKPGAKPSKPGVSTELEAKSRTRLIMMGAGGLAGLAALGGLIYLLRKRKGPGPLKIWQSFRKKEEVVVEEAIVEEVATQE